MPYLDELHKNGKLNNYLYNQLCDKLYALPKEMQHVMLNEAVDMSSIGISSPEDHKNFAYVKQHLRKVAEELVGRKLESGIIAKLSYVVYSNRINKPIDSIYNLYVAVDSALQEVGIMKKKVAYPVGAGISYINADSPYDVGKWMHAMRDIYTYTHRGLTTQNAFEIVTANWDVMEKKDFNSWMRFYQEGAHEKYKTAQYYQLEGDGPALIPMNHLKAKLPGMPDVGMPNMARYEDNVAVMEADRKEAVEKARRSAVSRLQAAERLMTRPDLLDSLKGLDLAKWLESLHALKRELQTLRLASERSVEDLIIRHGNILRSYGCKKEGFLLEKLAQEAPPAPTVEEVESDMPPMSPMPPDMDLPIDEEPEEDEALTEFIRRMNNEFFEDESDIDDEAYADDDLTVTAQALPAPTSEMPPSPIAPTQPPAERPAPPDIVVDEPLEELEGEFFEAPKHSGADDPYEEIDVTVEDVINRLESVADVLRKREIPRQLGIVDLMLDKLGFVGFFPTLAEAHRSALESNQYMATRIDDVLSKLRGAQEPQTEVELSTTPEENAERDDTLEEVRKNLSKQEMKERQRREKRKAEQVAKQEAATAQQAAAKELAGPVEVETAPPARITR